MPAIPENVLARFNEVSKKRAVHESFPVYYRKRLGSFLDICKKYPPPETRSDQVRLFLEKLKSKKQTPQQCTQAAHAVSLLAVKQRVASSTQNLAFNAQLFLCRHVLNKDFGDQRDVSRAKKSKYIPVVLSPSRHVSPRTFYRPTTTYDDSNNAEAHRCENDDDLYPLRTE